MTDTLTSLWHGQVVRKTTARQIIQEVAASHGLKDSDLIGPSRLKSVSWARHEAVWRIRQQTNLSLPQIGRILGGRDHTTALHSERRYAAKLKTLVAAE